MTRGLLRGAIQAAQKGDCAKAERTVRQVKPLVSPQDAADFQHAINAVRLNCDEELQASRESREEIEATFPRGVRLRGRGARPDAEDVTWAPPVPLEERDPLEPISRRLVEAQDLHRAAEAEAERRAAQARLDRAAAKRASKRKQRGQEGADAGGGHAPVLPEFFLRRGSKLRQVAVARKVDKVVKGKTYYRYRTDRDEEVPLDLLDRGTRSRSPFPLGPEPEPGPRQRPLLPSNFVPSSRFFRRKKG